MRKSRNNVSRYIDEMYSPKVKQSGNGVSPALFLLSIFSALFIFVLTAQPLVAGLLNKNTGGNSANAIGIACSTILGTGMNNKTGWASDGVGDYPLPNKAGRTWTVQEALGSGITLVNYDGEGNGGTLVRDKKTPTTNNYKKYAAQYKEKLEAERTVGNCWGGLFTRLANVGFGISNLITGLAKFFASTAFSTELICADPAKPTGNCFNLGKIIGGTGSSSGGIIGALTASIYLPLLVIAVTVAAFWIGYIGFVKRKIREALFGLIWVVAAVVVGLALLLNPSILAKAPIAFSNAVSTCVIGAFNGENCMSGSRTGAALDYKTGDKTSDRVCISDVNSASISQTMLLKTNAITCSIWKAFVLEPLSQSAFGMNFEDLDANTGAIAENVKAAGLTGDDFCIDLYSSKSYNQMKNDILALERRGNKKICNVMTYQMYLQVGAVSQSDEVKKPGEIPRNGSLDDRWYKVVAVAAANDNTWSYWAKGNGNFFMPMLAMLTSALGTFIIVITSVFALVYYIGSVLLMAFAPIFFLFAIHPGRGKKIFLGWVEKITSNLLKYLFSAVFLVATLAIYGAVLNDMSNIGMTLLFVIIITMALFMYRNELMGLLGRANMGGEQLSNAMSNSLGGMAKGAGSLAKGQIGKFAGHGTQGLAGAAGSLYAAKGASFGDKRAAIKAGFSDGAKRSVRRSGGVLGHAVAQYERASTDNKSDLRNKQAVLQQEKINAEKDSDTTQKELETAKTSMNSAVDEKENNQKRLAYHEDHLAQYRQAEKEATEEMATTSTLETNRQIQEIKADPTLSAAEKEEKIAAIEAEHKLVVDFTEFQNLSNTLNDAKVNLHIAEMTGDTAAAEENRQLIAELTPKKDALYGSLGAQNVSRLRKDYQVTLSENLNKDGVDNFTKEDFNNYVQLSVAVSQADEKVNAVSQIHDLRLAENELAQAEALRSKLIFESLEEQNNALRPGESVTDAKRDEMLQKAELAADEAEVGTARMDELREKVNRLKGEGEIPEGGSSFVPPVTGRSSVDADVRDDETLNDSSTPQSGQYNGPKLSAEEIGYTDSDAPDLEEPLPEHDDSTGTSYSAPSIPTRRPDFAENEQRAADEEEYIDSLNAERASSVSDSGAPSIPTSKTSPQFKKDEELFDAEEAMNAEGFQQTRGTETPQSPASAQQAPSQPQASQPRVENVDDSTGTSYSAPSIPTHRPDFAENEQRAADEEEYINSLNAERASTSVNASAPVSQARPQFKKDEELFDAEEAMNAEGFQQTRGTETPQSPASAQQTPSQPQASQPRVENVDDSVAPEPTVPASTASVQTGIPRTPTPATPSEAPQMPQTQQAPQAEAPQASAAVQGAVAGAAVNAATSNVSSLSSEDRELLKELKDHNAQQKKDQSRFEQEIKENLRKQNEQVEDMNAAVTQNVNDQERLARDVRGQHEEQELYRTSESARNEALRDDLNRRNEEREKARENALKEQQTRSESNTSDSSSINSNNNSGNDVGPTKSSASSATNSGRNPFIDDEPPMSPEEEAMVQKDDKTDRKEAMRRKSSEARARRSAENSNGEQLMWDSMEEQARIEQEEAMEESRYEAPAEPSRRSGVPRSPSTPSSGGFGRGVNEPTAKRPADLGDNAFKNRPENPLQGRGRNEGRRGRVIPTVDPQNMFDDEDDDE